jgi:hypothetical protein
VVVLVSGGNIESDLLDQILSGSSPKKLNG